MRRFAHVVQLRLTREDLVALQRMASVRNLTIEDLIRGECRLPSYLDELPPPEMTHSVLTDEAGLDRQGHGAGTKCLSW